MLAQRARPCQENLTSYTWPGSSWRPSACGAGAIATRPQVLVSHIHAGSSMWHHAHPRLHAGGAAAGLCENKGWGLSGWQHIGASDSGCVGAAARTTPMVRVTQYWRVACMPHTPAGSRRRDQVAFHLCAQRAARRMAAPHHRGSVGAAAVCSHHSVCITPGQDRTGDLQRVGLTS